MNSEIEIAEERLRKKIRNELDNLPLKEKIRMCLVTYTPVLPATEQEREMLIDEFVQGVLRDFNTMPEMRIKILDTLHLPYSYLDQQDYEGSLKAAVKARVKIVSPEDMLRLGVFGKPTTAEHVEKAKKMIEDIYFTKMVRDN